MHFVVQISAFLQSLGQSEHLCNLWWIYKLEAIFKLVKLFQIGNGINVTAWFWKAGYHLPVSFPLAGDSLFLCDDRTEQRHFNFVHNLQAADLIFKLKGKETKGRTNPSRTGALGNTVWSCWCSLLTWHLSRTKSWQVSEQKTWTEINENIWTVFIPQLTTFTINAFDSLNSSYLPGGCWGFGSATCWVEAEGGAACSLTCFCPRDWTAWFLWHKSMLFY